MAIQFVFDQQGSGDPVLMVHGLGGTSNVFAPQAETLARYFRVLRPDLPGAGRAALTSLQGEVSIESLTGHLLALLDREAITSAHLVGHSMGTILCQHLAARHPDRVRSLALVGPIFAPSDPARKALADRAAKAQAEGMADIAEAIVQGGISAATRYGRPEIAAFVRELIMRQDPEGYAAHCRALAAAQAADTSLIACPALLLTGSVDLTSSPAATCDLARRFVNASMQILPDCGHWAPLERSSDLTSALMNFYFKL